MSGKSTRTRKPTQAQREQQRAKITRLIAMIALVTGAVVSVAANVVSAQPTVLGRVVAGWPAVALLITIHMYSHARRTFWVKLAILAVALVAAWVSYWHMFDVVIMAGESVFTAHIMPVTVDAMMGVATAVLTTRERKPARRASTRTRAGKTTTTAKVTPIRAARSA